MRESKKSFLLSVVRGTSSEMHNSFLQGFLSRPDLRIRLIGAFLLTVVVSACGGGGGGSSTSQPEQPAATVNSYLLQQEPNDMAETDADYESQVKVVALAEAPTSYEIESADNAGATRPVIDSIGVITWRPIPADSGVRRFNLVVKGNNSTTTRLPFTIQVGPWRTMVDQTFDQSGGSQCDATNQYCVTVAANQVAPGNANLRARLRSFVREDGGIGLMPTVEGAVDLPKIRFRVPDVGTLLPDTTALTRVSPVGVLRAKPSGVTAFQRSDADPLPNLTVIETWKGTRIESRAIRPLFPTLITRLSEDDVFMGVHPDIYRLYAKNQGAYINPSYVASLSGDCGETQACDKNHTPVLLLHGFNLNCNYSGGTGTWGRADEFIRSTMRGNVFEFQYRTCMRFEEAAGILAEAVRIVRAKTGHKPLIVAHSFGGIVASTYLKGLAVRVLSVADVILKDEIVEYRDDVAGLITVGSPLSGIAAHHGTTPGGVDMTQGRDSADIGVSTSWFFTCQQITCHQAGAEFSDHPKSTDFNISETARNYYLGGVRIYGQGGELIAKLRARNYPVTTRVLVANGTARPADNTTQYCDAGDGLIAVGGQAVDPDDFLTAPFAVSDLCAKQARDVRMNRSTDGLLSSSKDPNVTYQFMMRNVTLPLTGVAGGVLVDANWNLRFTHTGIHRAAARIFPAKEISHGGATSNLVWGEASDLTSVGRLFVEEESSFLGQRSHSYKPAWSTISAGVGVIDVGEHPLATAIREVSLNLVLDAAVFDRSLLIRGSFNYQSAVRPVGIVNSSGVDITVPYTIQIFNKATGQSRARHSDRTDLQGNMLFDYGAWFERLEAVGVDFSKYYMVVTAGDPLECAPTATRVDNLTADVDLGQIKLCSGATAPIVTSLTFSSSGAGGTVTAIFDRSMQPRAGVSGDYIRGSGDLWLDSRTYTFGIASFTPGGQITLQGNAFTSASGVPMGADRTLKFPTILTVAASAFPGAFFLNPLTTPASCAITATGSWNNGPTANYGPDGATASTCGATCNLPNSPSVALIMNRGDGITGETIGSSKTISLAVDEIVTFSNNDSLAPFAGHPNAYFDNVGSVTVTISCR